MKTPDQWSVWLTSNFPEMSLSERNLIIDYATMEEVKTAEQKKDDDLRMLISGILFHTLRMSEDGKAIDAHYTGQVFFEQMNIYASQQTASLREENKLLREALEKIKNISRETGRDGCTYGDTDFDSQSACYGYNLCREHVQDIAIEALETQLSTTNGKQG